MENKKASLESANNPIYKDFFFNNKFVQTLEIHNTIWNGKDSNNSFSLKDKNTQKEEIPNILQRTFGIKEKNLFIKKYNEAISGDGQEWKRITTLHSSSLIALLCFYSVSKEHPLTIGDYTYEQSYFEVKTVVHYSHKSNMDIVLRGFNNKTGKKAVLFLESKFTEYLNCSKKDDISIDAYENEYNKLTLFKNSIENIKFSKGEKYICIESVNPNEFPIYCGGIKQMLSHYIGVCNYATEKYAEHKSFKYADDEEVILGEIMFNFEGLITNSLKKLKNYMKVYSELAKRINEHQSRVRMLEKIITYQEIFSGDFIKENKIKQFYKL